MAITEVVSEPGASPFRREGLARRVIPFGGLALAAQASSALPPGPASLIDLIISSVLLAMVGACFLARFDKLPRFCWPVPLLLYVASVALLELAQGGSTSGVAIIIFMPIVWASLYHRRWEAVVVLGGVLVAVYGTAVVDSTDVSILVRRLAFEGAFGAVIVVGVNQLRHQAASVLFQRDEARRARALSTASRELAALLEPLDIIKVAVRVASELIALPAMPAMPVRRGASYFIILDRTARLEERFGESEFRSETLSLASHPLMEVAVRTRGTVAGRIERAELRAVLDPAGVADGAPEYGAFIPVVVSGNVHGVLALAAGVFPLSSQVVDECKALGASIEVALNNALEHDSLRDQATTDFLTGLANRRRFTEAVQEGLGGHPFVILAVDIDKLKHINDEQGHAAGDRFLVRTAEVLQLSLRRGDLLARMGGDEFAAILFDAGVAEGCAVAERMLHTLRASKFEGVKPRVSIGIACGGRSEDPEPVQLAADVALYEAKRQGGMRFELAN